MSEAEPKDLVELDEESEVPPQHQNVGNSQNIDNNGTGKSDISSFEAKEKRKRTLGRNKSSATSTASILLQRIEEQIDSVLENAADEAAESERSQNTNLSEIKEQGELLEEPEIPYEPEADAATQELAEYETTYILENTAENERSQELEDSNLSEIDEQSEPLKEPQILFEPKPDAATQEPAEYETTSILENDAENAAENERSHELQDANLSETEEQGKLWVEPEIPYEPEPDAATQELAEYETTEEEPVELGIPIERELPDADFEDLTRLPEEARNQDVVTSPKGIQPSEERKSSSGPDLAEVSQEHNAESGSDNSSFKVKERRQRSLGRNKSTTSRATILLQRIEDQIDTILENTAEEAERSQALQDANLSEIEEQSEPLMEPEIPYEPEPDAATQELAEYETTKEEPVELGIPIEQALQDADFAPETPEEAGNQGIETTSEEIQPSEEKKSSSGPDLAEISQKHDAESRCKPPGADILSTLFDNFEAILDYILEDPCSNECDVLFSKTSQGNPRNGMSSKQREAQDVQAADTLVPKKNRSDALITSSTKDNDHRDVGLRRSKSLPFFEWKSLKNALGFGEMIDSDGSVSPMDLGTQVRQVIPKQQPKDTMRTATDDDLGQEEKPTKEYEQVVHEMEEEFYLLGEEGKKRFSQKQSQASSSRGNSVQSSKSSKDSQAQLTKKTRKSRDGVRVRKRSSPPPESVEEAVAIIERQKSHSLTECEPPTLVPLVPCIEVRDCLSLPPINLDPIVLSPIELPPIELAPIGNGIIAPSIQRPSKPTA